MIKVKKKILRTRRENAHTHLELMYEKIGKCYCQGVRGVYLRAARGDPPGRRPPALRLRGAPPVEKNGVRGPEENFQGWKI